MMGAPPEVAKCVVCSRRAAVCCNEGIMMNGRHISPRCVRCCDCNGEDSPHVWGGSTALPAVTPEDER